MLKYFNREKNTDYILEWKSKGISDEVFKVTTTDNIWKPSLAYGNKIKARFIESCLKQERVTYDHRKTVNIYIVYGIISYYSWSNDHTLGKCLFGTVTLTENADMDKYRYSGYRIGFDKRGSFSFPGTGLGRNIIIFGVDMGSSTKIDNIKKDTLILGKGPPQGLEHTLSAKKCIQLILQ